VRIDAEKTKSVALIVAHPDDETLWAGGMILSNPEWNWFIVCLCRRSDTERASKFGKAIKILRAKGIMGDLDDGPQQIPLDDSEVENSIMELLPQKHYDLLITHNITGEYTRHRRHEEISIAVIKLWQNGKISATELWTFAYEDGDKAYFPIAFEKASVFKQLTQNIWNKKYNIITETYGFDQNSWEAKTVPHEEAFWQFKNHIEAKGRLTQFEIDKKVVGKDKIHYSSPI
jgi:LmbE family N-acetylglucosaminyl deacetylase